VGNGKRYFHRSLLGDLRSITRSHCGVQGLYTLAKNKFGAFLVSQNTPGQVLVDQLLPRSPEFLKAAPLKESNML